ncbi:MAG: hypothetical protein CMC70_03125 [Flavobacteriaceae bacterium]|nr:hypothetical protein [Flavobacteriaceae bacterium]
MIHLYVALPVHPKRRHIFPLLKPFEKGDRFTDEERLRMYDISEKEIKFVTAVQEADYVVLPMSWNFYLAQDAIKPVEKVIDESLKANKKVLSFMVGDFGVKIKEYPNVIVFRQSGERSKLPNTHQGLPAFIEDPLPKYIKTKTLPLRDYQETPTVGFCGQATSSIGNASTEILKTLARNTKSFLGMSKAPGQQVLSTSYFRANVLRQLEKSPSITTNFILRKKYRAGATTAETRKKTTLEFYENIRDSDYVVCARGAGNFSVRFYETLAMGRIPVFINTNCLLPLPNKIDWKKQVVWVNYEDRDRVSEKVLNFHKRLSHKQFQDLQQQNRSLWQEQLTLGGFFKTYADE